MITQADLDECNAWIAASDERTSTAPHPDAPPVPFGAGASAHPLTVHGAASAPAAPFSHRADQVQELGRMIETLRIVSEETRRHLVEITLAQEAIGWPDFKIVDDGAAHLERLASDLHVHLRQFKYQLTRFHRTRATPLRHAH